MGGLAADIQLLQDYFESFSPSKIYWTIILCIWVEYFFELYLCLRQRRVYFQSAGKIPPALEKHMSLETFEKARLYGIDKNNFTIISEFYGMVVLTALLHYEGLYRGWQLTLPMVTSFGYWPTSWDLEIGRSIAFSILAMAFNNIVGLPLSLYSTFILEERHGFNNQTVAFFVKDFFKKILVSLVITSPVVGLIVKIVQAGGQYFFVWLWIFCFVVLMFLMTIYPMLIAPLFDKYTPLKEGPLRTRIEGLAKRIHFPLTKLYVVEGSKRSAHSNAYLYGFFNNKRIVLYDTLIKGYVKEEVKEEDGGDQEETREQQEEVASLKKPEEKGCDDQEIEAVLGHELGHWKLNHVAKNIIISQANLFIIFCLFAFFYRNGALYQAFGFPKGEGGEGKGVKEMPILLGLIIVLQFLLQIFNTAMGYLMNVLSRLFEFQADRFAVELGYGQFLKGALIKLNKDNLGFPVSDGLYSAWHHSHPTLLQRLGAIDELAKKGK